MEQAARKQMLQAGVSNNGTTLGEAGPGRTLKDDYQLTHTWNSGRNSETKIKMLVSVGCSLMLLVRKMNFGRNLPACKQKWQEAHCGRDLPCVWNFNLNRPAQSSNLVISELFPHHKQKEIIRYLWTFLWDLLLMELGEPIRRQAQN